MELRDYVRVLRKSWVLILVCFLVGTGVAAAYSLTRTPIYTASSKVFVSTQADNNSVQELQQGSAFSLARVTTYTNLVKTPIVLNPVIASLGLDVTADSLSSMVSASATLNTTLITIDVTDPDPTQGADIANALAVSLASAVEQIETPSGASVSPVRLTKVQEATPALKPSSPNVPLNLALGALIGLALGIGVAVLRATLDTRIRNERDIAIITDVPIIGGIAFDARADERPLIVHEDPHSARAESFRSLRTNLQFVDFQGANSFVVTSSVPAEGKSTTTVNLAIAMSDAGSRVVLIDADLRKPNVANYMGLEGGAGLTDVLIGRAALEDVMQRWGRGHLYVLPAGKIPPNPSELLGSTLMKQLIARLDRDFDMIIFDSPPLLPVTDAAILAAQTGGAIVVVSAGHTTRGQLQDALETLEHVDAKVAGVVFSKVPTKGPDSYGYGRYGYGYIYGADAGGKPRSKRKGKRTNNVGKAGSRSQRASNDS